MIRAIAVSAVLVTAGVSHAATGAEFYLNLLARGVAEFDAGRYDSAATQLRIAAFGLMDAVEQYQTAQIYLTLSSNRLTDVENARIAARRVVSAEKIGKTYGSLPVPAAVKSSFESVAKTLLTPAEVAALSTSPRTAPVREAQKPPATQAKAPAPPQTTAATTTAATQPQTKPEPPKPEPAKPQEPAQKTENATPPRNKQTASTQAAPRKETPKPQPQPAVSKTTPQKAAPPPAAAKPAATPARDVSASLTEAERALAASNRTEAKKIYRELLTMQLTHEQFLRVSEGLYRSRDFAQALKGFERAGALRKGEEPYRYYIAVALYETGKYAEAKKELAAALPFIEVTPDVAQYRTKIESAGVTASAGR